MHSASAVVGSFDITVTNTMSRPHHALVRISCAAALLFCTYAAKTADAQAGFPAEWQSPSSELRDIITTYDADRQALLRSEATSLSSKARDHMRVFYQSWRTHLNQLPFDNLSHDGKSDYLLLRNQLDHELRSLEIQDRELKETEPLLPFAPAIVKLSEDLRCMQFVTASNAATTLHTINAQVEGARRSLAVINVPAFVANRAAGEVDQLKASLKGWFDFYNGYDPSFSWWIPGTYKQLDANLQAYAVEIREQKAGIKPGDKTTIVGNPIGRDALISELRYEMISYTPEQLLTLANREYAWCEEEMKRASRAMGFGDDWHKALEKVKSDYVEPGKQPELIRNLALEAIEFVDKHDLVTIPEIARESWRMEMMTPQRQLINPFFTGGEVLSVSYPTDTMDYEQKLMSMRGNNVHFARATVFHEVIPGHELQGFMAERYRPWRRIFDTPFYPEGWALYWEMLFWDMNFAKTPEDRIGMLFWRMHRAARILFSLNFHLRKWTPQQCVDFLVNNGHERENAAAEVRRSFLGQDRPLYQAAYMLGGLQLRWLRKELVDSGKMSNRQFHDAILKENSIPIEMLRADLTNQTLTRDFAPSWKFYGDIQGFLDGRP
jgi:hypothetical protein